MLCRMTIGIIPESCAIYYALSTLDEPGDLAERCRAQDLRRLNSGMQVGFPMARWWHLQPRPLPGMGRSVPTSIFDHPESPAVLSRPGAASCHDVLSLLLLCWLPRFTMSFRYNLEGSLLAPRVGTAVHNVIADISHIPDRKQPFRQCGDIASTREEECACNHDGSNEGKNIAPTLYDVFFAVLSRETLPVTPPFHSCGKRDKLWADT